MSEQVLNSQADLLYTKAVRKRLIETLTEDNKMPAEPKTQMVLLSALDGIDRAAMGLLRIEADRDISNKQSDASAILAELFRDGRTLKVGIELGQRTEPPTLSESIQPSIILEGELSTSPSIDTFDAFSLRAMPG